MQFDAVVEVRPQIAVPGYGGLRVTVPSPEVTDDEIDAQVDRLRGNFGRLETFRVFTRTGKQHPVQRAPGPELVVGARVEHRAVLHHDNAVGQ